MSTIMNVEPAAPIAASSGRFDVLSARMAPVRLVGRLRAQAVWIGSTIAGELRVRRDMRHLRGLSDAHLNDLGLDRWSLEQALRSGVARKRH